MEIHEKVRVSPFCFCVFFWQFFIYFCQESSPLSALRLHAPNIPAGRAHQQSLRRRLLLPSRLLFSGGLCRFLLILGGVFLSELVCLLQVPETMASHPRAAVAEHFVRSLWRDLIRVNRNRCVSHVSRAALNQTDSPEVTLKDVPAAAAQVLIERLHLPLRVDLPHGCGMLRPILHFKIELIRSPGSRKIHILFREG